MKCYLQVKRLHSEKKNKDYTQVIMNLYGKDYFLRTGNEEIMTLLDMKPSEVGNLPVGYESKKLEIVVD